MESGQYAKVKIGIGQSWIVMAGHIGPAESFAPAALVKCFLLLAIWAQAKRIIPAAAQLGANMQIFVSNSCCLIGNGTVASGAFVPKSYDFVSNRWVFPHSLGRCFGVRIIEPTAVPGKATLCMMRNLEIERASWQPANEMQPSRVLPSASFHCRTIGYGRNGWFINGEFHG